MGPNRGNAAVTFRDRLRATRGPSLRTRLLAVLALAVVGQAAASLLHLDQLDRIGQSAALTDEVWVPMARLATRMEGQAARGAPDRLAQTVASAKTLADRPVADPEERAALLAARAQLDQIAAAVADPERAAAEIAQLTGLADSRIEAVSRRTARAQSSARQVSLALAAGIPLVGALLWWLVGRALRPLRDLTEAAGRLGEGGRPDFAVGGVDEVGRLAGTLDRMARAVEERDRNLQALSGYLRRVLDAISAAVVVSEQGRVTMANPAAAASWKVEAGTALPAWLAELADGRHEELELDGRHHDVVVGPFDASARIFVGEDVTRRRADRERLRRSERLALVGQLMAQITHEVRNPLNAMSLHAELLAEEPLPEEARPLLATLTKELARLEALTERYLDLSRSRAPELAPEDPVRLAEEVAAGRARVEGEVGVVEFAGQVARQALLNLVRNAVEAGARSVSLRVRRDEQLEWVVEDDGPGIDPAALSHVFEPFWTTRARGTGLGLFISRQAVEEAGGTLSVTSTPGVGSRFCLRLPVG